MVEKSDLPQGTLDLLILKVIALGPVHGYAIAQRLEQVSRGVVQVPQGSLYPALHRLENRGLLAADWEETESGREAKFYRLTRKGRMQLETETASWQRLIEAVGLVLKLSEGDRKSTRLNSSHEWISYAVFCLKKKRRSYRRWIATWDRNLDAHEGKLLL